MSRPMLRPSPEALAADPPPFRCLGVEDGAYVVEHNPTEGTGTVARYHSTRMVAPDGGLFQYRWTYALPWLRRHFGKPRTILWADGRVDPVEPEIVWPDFAVWLRDACEEKAGVPATGLATAAAKQPSPSGRPATHMRSSSARSSVSGTHPATEATTHPSPDTSAAPPSSSQPRLSPLPGSAQPLSRHSAPVASPSPLAVGLDDGETAPAAAQADDAAAQGGAS